MKVRCFIVVGGLGNGSHPKAEIITNFGKRQLPPLLDWEGIDGGQMAVHDGEILLFPVLVDDEMSESKLKCFKFALSFLLEFLLTGVGWNSNKTAILKEFP